VTSILVPSRVNARVRIQHRRNETASSHFVRALIGYVLSIRTEGASSSDQKYAYQEGLRGAMI